MVKKPRVLGRPDPETGKRKDITAESIKLSRKRQKEKAAGVIESKIAFKEPVPVPKTAITGQEYVFEFSGPIGTTAAKYISKLASLIGGKRAYIEDKNKLVVVL